MQEQEARGHAYANMVYMCWHKAHPFLTKGCTRAVHILHVIVDVHRNLSPIYHLKFLISSLSEAKRSKRLFSKNRATPQIIASIALQKIGCTSATETRFIARSVCTIFARHPRNDATKVTKRFDTGK